MESTPTSLLIEPQHQVDSELWEHFEQIKITGAAAVSKLRPSKEVVATERSRFNASEYSYIPDLRPYDTDIDAVDAREQRALIASAAIAEVDTDPDLKQAYLDAINVHVSDLRMIKAAATGDYESFAMHNTEIYGHPDRDIFASVADTFCQLAEANVDSLDPYISQAASTILNGLGPHRGNASLIVPSPDVFKAVKDDHYRNGGYYALLLAGVTLPTSGRITPENGGEAALHQVLRNLESEYTTADSPNKNWSISSARKQALRPVTYAMTPERFIGLGLGHEIGTHLLERENGLRGPIRLLSNSPGMDHAELTGEGRAVTREQIVFPTFDKFAEEKRWQDIMRRFLVIGLAEGLTGKAMNFAESYEIVNAIDRLHDLLAASSNDSTNQIVQDAHKRTWNLLDAAYQGTDGERGGAYRRNMVYLAGNVACWQAAREDPRIIQRGDVGKHNILSPRHRDLNNRYGVYPVAA